ncbi:hypothetical protein [Corallincola spongiicola]|uniref:Uncharacterized protein n=1 Tax=Corallincola spongiicola TaxID=2520508 RepID=A0ABY1WL16_9GAMM|nr:hypothetical protein [Corallincola spongiicola]TAA41021.1 hypothetical protein EXY25_17115 [Corallincola spongiicola]
MRPITSVALSLSLVASNAAADNVPKSFVEKVFAKSMQEQCASSAYLACLDISAAECQNLADLYIKTCIAPLPDQVSLGSAAFGSEMEACGMKFFEKQDIELGKVEACDDAMEMAEQESVYHDELTPEQLEELMRAEQLKQQQEMQAFVDMMREATGSGNRLEEITLPLYEPYELGIHMADGAAWEELRGLPAVTFRVNASKDEVLAFYKQKLPTFKVDPNDPYRLVEKVLPGEETIAKYINVPHVAIYGDTFVQLTYRR